MENRTKRFRFQRTKYHLILKFQSLQNTNHESSENQIQDEKIENLYKRIEPFQAFNRVTLSQNQRGRI